MHKLVLWLFVILVLLDDFVPLSHVESIEFYLGTSYHPRTVRSSLSCTLPDPR
jgi:hypothetical protein